MIKQAYLRARSILGLSLQLARAEFILKNEGSYLGIFWYLLNPILTFALLFLVFSDRLGSGIPSYPLYLLLGIIMFNLFRAMTLESTRAIRENSHLIKSINFHRESLIISIAFKNLFSHVFEVVLFVALVLFLHGSLISILWYIPIIIPFTIFTVGASFLLSSLTVFFVDLDNVWNFAVQLVWLGTPIFYAIGGQTRLFYINLCNPVYYFITIARDAIIYHSMPAAWLIWGALGFSAFSLFLGLAIFRALDARAAELI